MKSHRQAKNGAAALALGLLLGVFASSAMAEKQDRLEALMASLARVDGVQSMFIEQKRLALLDAPLRYEGRLIYRAPGYLKKEITKPRLESFEIDNGRLVIARGGERRELALKELPQLQALIESLRATLAGDLISLRRHYDIRFKAVGSGWTLNLVPQAKEVKRFISEVTVGGADVAITSVEIRESNGDLSRMEIRSVP
jgi:outer membrane lipoprotein-sorting protein